MKIKNQIELKDWLAYKKAKAQRYMAKKCACGRMISGNKAQCRSCSDGLAAAA